MDGSGGAGGGNGRVGGGSSSLGGIYGGRGCLTCVIVANKEKTGKGGSNGFVSPICDRVLKLQADLEVHLASQRKALRDSFANYLEILIAIRYSLRTLYLQKNSKRTIGDLVEILLGDRCLHCCCPLGGDGYCRACMCALCKKFDEDLVIDRFRNKTKTGRWLQCPSPKCGCYVHTDGALERGLVRVLTEKEAESALTGLPETVAAVGAGGKGGAVGEGGKGGTGGAAVPEKAASTTGDTAFVVTGQGAEAVEGAKRGREEEKDTGARVGAGAASGSDQDRDARKGSESNGGGKRVKVESGVIEGSKVKAEPDAAGSLGAIGLLNSPPPNPSPPNPLSPNPLSPNPLSPNPSPPNPPPPIRPPPSPAPPSPLPPPSPNGSASRADSDAAPSASAAGGEEGGSPASPLPSAGAGTGAAAGAGAGAGAVAGKGVGAGARMGAGANALGSPESGGKGQPAPAGKWAFAGGGGTGARVPDCMQYVCPLCGYTSAMWDLFREMLTTSAGVKKKDMGKLSEEMARVVRVTRGAEWCEPYRRLQERLTVVMQSNEGVNKVVGELRACFGVQGESGRREGFVGGSRGLLVVGEGHRGRARKKGMEEEERLHNSLIALLDQPPYIPV
ncbi:unnamed protein product [Closterium sp. NIES-54]